MKRIGYAPALTSMGQLALSLLIDQRPILVIRVLQRHKRFIGLSYK